MNDNNTDDNDSSEKPRSERYWRQKYSPHEGCMWGVPIGDGRLAVFEEAYGARPYPETQGYTLDFGEVDEKRGHQEIEEVSRKDVPDVILEAAENPEQLPDKCYQYPGTE